MGGAHYAAKNAGVAYESDVAVFGAGPAGTAAAIAAARAGQRVLLVEATDRIGGVMSTCPGMMLGGGYVCGESIGGFFEEYVDRLYHHDPPVAERRACSLANFGDEVVYDHEYAVPILHEMVRDAGVRLLLQRTPRHVALAGDAVTGVELVTTQGDESCSAGVYIDCTGNGDVAAKAGVPSRQGDDRGLTMGATLTFFMENVDRDRAFEDISDPYFTAFAERGIADGRLHRSLHQIYMLRGFRPGSVYFNTVTVCGVDGTDADSVAEATRIARRRAMDLARFCREEMPGFADSHLSCLGPVVGVRETRRIEGVYCLTIEDVSAAAKFHDGIVACDSPLDEVFRDETASVYSHEAAVPPGAYYTIPYRTLVPRRVRNLLFAGRNRSVDVEAFASGRGMPHCMVMGQAVGVAAAMANRERCRVQDVDAGRLVETLVEQGVNGIGGRPLSSPV